MVPKANKKTAAARYNVKVLLELQSVLLKDPEADLAAALSTTYPQQLKSLKRSASMRLCAAPSLPDNDIRHRLDEDQPVHAIFPLSSDVKALSHGFSSVARAIIGLLGNGEVIYESAWAASVTVFRISKDIVVKAGHEDFAITEHRTLTYLQAHKPDFPAPKPHGLVRMGAHSFLFTSYVPGTDLEKAWPELDAPQKHDLSSQLDTLLTDLRSTSFPKGIPLGGVDGGGCRDLRRIQRTSTEPIMSVEEFESFAFNWPTSTPYIALLRSMLPKSANIVFTHGDIRPANIIVRRDDSRTWSVAALIDWDSSGFYPEYWEAIKVTNLLTPKTPKTLGGDSDWYDFIPKSVCPNLYATHWLVDRLEGRNAVGG
jgi:aminoglycoside phosphotransferase